MGSGLFLTLARKNIAEEKKEISLKGLGAKPDY